MRETVRDGLAGFGLSKGQIDFLMRAGALVGVALLARVRIEAVPEPDRGRYSQARRGRGMRA